MRNKNSNFPFLSFPEVGGLPIFPPSLWEPVQAMQTGISGVTMAQLLADSLVKLVAFFIIFGLISGVLGAILGLVANILTRITHLVLLGGVNRLGGMAGGLIANGLFLVIAVGMLTPLIYSFGMGTALFNNWESSVMVPYFNKTWGVVAQYCPSTLTWFSGGQLSNIRCCHWADGIKRLTDIVLKDEKFLKGGNIPKENKKYYNNT